MGFLNPLLWIGALAVAFPIWLHLRDRRVERVIRFPSLRLLADEPVPAARPARLRNPLLLLVRLLALLAVVAAFARPWIAGEPPAALAESRVHVLDNTLSHQAGDGFLRDRDRIARILGSAAGQVEHAVVELGAVPRVVARFGDDPAAAAQRVRAIEPSSERGSYLAAARLASSLLERGLGERRVIVFHGDGQRNQWAEGESALPFLEGVEVEVANPPEVAQKPNLAVSFPEARRGWEGEAPTVELTFQVRYTEHAYARVEVRSGRTPILSKRIELPPFEGTEAGSLIVRAAWPADPTAWLGGEVSVEAAPDALGGDDRAFFAVPPLTEGRVALLARSRYLATALAPEVMRGRWAVRRWSPDPPGADDPEYDVMVVEASYLPSRPVKERVASLLAKGRGVVIVLDHTSPLVAGALRELGVELEGVGEVGDPLPFRYVAAQHPVFRAFLGGGLGDVQEAHVFRYFRIRPDRVQSILFSASGDPLVAEVPGVPGRLLLVAFPLEREHTDWPLQTSFVPFIDQALAYVRKQEDDDGPSAPGDWRVLPVPSDRRVARLEVSGRNGFHQEIEVDGGETVRFRSPAQPGLYEVRFDGRLERLLPVNPAAEESALEYEAEPRAIAVWTSARAPEPERAGIPSGKPVGAEQQSWWHSLLVVALVLTALELVILGLHGERRAPA